MDKKNVGQKISVSERKIGSDRTDKQKQLGRCISSNLSGAGRTVHSQSHAPAALCARCRPEAHSGHVIALITAGGAPPQAAASVRLHDITAAQRTQACDPALCPSSVWTPPSGKSSTPLLLQRVRPPLATEPAFYLPRSNGHLQAARSPPTSFFFFTCSFSCSPSRRTSAPSFTMANSKR